MPCCVCDRGVQEAKCSMRYGHGFVVTYVVVEAGWCRGVLLSGMFARWACFATLRVSFDLALSQS